MKDSRKQDRLRRSEGRRPGWNFRKNSQTVASAWYIKKTLLGRLCPGNCLNQRYVSWGFISYFRVARIMHVVWYIMEKEMATHSSILAWRIPGMGEPGGLPSMGSHRVGHDWSDSTAAAALRGGRWCFFRELDCCGHLEIQISTRSNRGCQELKSTPNDCGVCVGFIWFGLFLLHPLKGPACVTVIDMSLSRDGHPE